MYARDETRTTRQFLPVFNFEFRIFNFYLAALLLFPAIHPHQSTDARQCPTRVLKSQACHKSSAIVQTWSVRFAAIAGVRSMALVVSPDDLVQISWRQSQTGEAIRKDD
jgi:hypothetical protein